MFVYNFLLLQLQKKIFVGKLVFCKSSTFLCVDVVTLCSFCRCSSRSLRLVHTDSLTYTCVLHVRAYVRAIRPLSWQKWSRSRRSRKIHALIALSSCSTRQSRRADGDTTQRLASPCGCLLIPFSLIDKSCQPSVCVCVHEWVPVALAARLNIITPQNVFHSLESWCHSRSVSLP